MIKNRVVMLYFFLFVQQVFDMLLEGTDLTQKVMDNTKLFREEMTKAGFNVIVSSFNGDVNIYVSIEQNRSFD